MYLSINLNYKDKLNNLMGKGCNKNIIEKDTSSFNYILS